MIYDLRFKKRKSIVLSLYLFIALLLQTQWVRPVFAQEATDSGILASPSASVTPTVFPLDISSGVSTLSGQPISSQSQNPFLPLDNSTPPQSALLRLPVKINLLSKRDYRAKEGVQFDVENATPDEVSVSVVGPDGKDVTSGVTKTSNQASTTVLLAPPDAFKPGKYTVTLTSTDGTTSQQDFTWGVLAINTNKSIYLPGETAQLAMAVLDNGGSMVCNGAVTLVITDPQGKKTTLSTDNKGIVVNPQCLLHKFSLTPDYSASYQVDGAGSYALDLTAVTPDGTHSISDSFTVQNSVAFDVERITATRIYPPLNYPNTFTITANQDFTGKVVELVPTSFDINPATDGSTSYINVVSVGPVLNMQDAFGVDSLSLGLPFLGTHKITQGFGVAVLKDSHERDLYAQFGLAGHDGLDFDLQQGTPVLSTDDGVVALAGDGAYGTTIVIDHVWGRSYYGHLSKLEVTVGQHVTKGQEIGLSGDTGLVSEGPHLHFGIRPKNPNMNNGFYGKVDPSYYLGLSDDINRDLSIALPSLTDTQKAIIWDVSVKKGDKITLGYTYKTPNISPMFYTIGPLSFITNDNQAVFQESRVWQLAIDYSAFPTTSYLSNTLSAAGTGATAWQAKISAPAAANTTTSVKQARSTGYIQWQPGAASKTFGALPTDPDGTGWIYDTSVNGTIPTGTWTFNVETTTTSATGTGHVVVCAWVVHLSGGTSGTVTKDSTIFPSSANCAEGSTNIMGSGTGNVTSSVSVASVPATTFTQTQYLYVEYWLRMTGAGSSSIGTTTFRVNEGSVEDIVTPGSSTNASPAAPSNDSPTNGATSVSTTPTFLMTSASDAESNSVQYRVSLYTGSCGGTAVSGWPVQQSSSQTGWSGQNATCSVSNDCYTIGTQGSYVTQTALQNSTTYYWKAGVMDPLGKGAWVDNASCNSFTTQAAGPTLDQLMRHGQWFNSSGVIQPFTF